MTWLARAFCAPVAAVTGGAGAALRQYWLPLALSFLLLLAVIATLAVFVALRRRGEKKSKKALELSNLANAKMNDALILAEEANAARGAFMSQMSHEIRTPLNAIIGYDAIAAGELADARTEDELRLASVKALDCLAKSDVAAKHLLSVINDVLDMSAIDSGRVKIAADRFDFKRMISSLTLLFYSQAKAKGVDFKVLLDTLTEEWFVGDQLRTNQIFTNLLSNAVKFTPPGGSVTLSICQPETTDDSARISFTVADTGIGMSKEFLGELWTPFRQADASISRRFGGTGLGLSITKNLVELMGGEITVESEPDVGTSFTVDLTFGRTAQPHSDAEYSFSLVNALIVDDEAGTREYVRMLFERCGARCTTVASGAEAIEAVKASLEQNDPFTVCLIDWLMPEMDGIETVARIRKIAGASMPIIIVSAYDLSDVADSARAAGADSFISKPLFHSTVFDMLANISGKRSDKAQAKKARYDFGGARILLAEDNLMNMEIAKTILSSAGLTVDEAKNGLEALAMWGSAPAGTYKAILMDAHMPEMDGYAATREIRGSAHPEAQTVPIIAMTADVFAEDVTKALSSGMNGHIAKPIDVDNLFETLKKHIPAV